MAAFTALALGLLGGALFGKLGSGGSDSASGGTAGRTNPNAPTPLDPTTPPSTVQSAAAAVPMALTASDRVKKRAAAGDTILTAAQTPTLTGDKLQSQPAKLLGA